MPYGMEKNSYLNFPFISGGQIVFQWCDIETGYKEYDFSKLEELMRDFHDKGIFTTLQINGNRKPEWLYEKVPVNKNKLSTQIKDEDGTLMYWHPIFIDAYESFLKSLGKFLENNKYKETLI